MENQSVPKANGLNKFTIAITGVAALAASIVVGVISAPYVRAESPFLIQTGPGPEFDVASVKSDKSPTGVDRVHDESGTLLVENVSLKRIIGMAYGVEEGKEYLFSGPSWLDNERFDIEAKYPPETSERDVLRMLQNLLSERFHLRVHRESRNFSAFALIAAKNGPKIHPKILGPDDRPVYQFQTQPGHLSASSATLDMLADRLSRPAF